MRTPLRLLLPSLLLLAAAACGGSGVNAVVGAGTLTVKPAGGEAAPMSGPIAFLGNTTVTSGESGGRVRVALGAEVTETTNADGAPGAGFVDFDLVGTTELRRREGAAFDLDDGIARIRATKLTSRLVVFHGTCFLEVRPGDNPAGIDVHLTTNGDQLKAEVAKGKVLLNATGATQKDLLYVTLEADEMSIAKPGEAPQKGATDWFDDE